MLINTENKRIEAVYPADMNGTVKCLFPVDKDALRPRDDSGVFSLETARYAAALAMSASSETMLRENLTKLGYEKIVFLNYSEASESKNGLALAMREDRDTTTVIAVLRPTVGREWYSNFEIGYGTEHSGFLKAAEYAEQRLSDYLFVRHPRHSPQFLVTGYSRGGAAANILAKRLCDRFGLDAVRGYTFASPNTCVTVKGARYSSIFNLTRDEDFFTRVPLAGWGYTRYGATLSLSDRGDIRPRYKKLSGEDYIGFSDSAAVEDFLCAVMRLAPNIHAYYERRYPVGVRMLSLSEYMLTVARILAEDTDEITGGVMMDSLSGAFAGLTDFLLNGMDVTALLSPAEGIPRCSVSDSHSPAAYMAALELMDR